MPVKSSRRKGGKKIVSKKTIIKKCEPCNDNSKNCISGGLMVLIAILFLGISMMFFALVQMHSQTHRLLYKAELRMRYDQVNNLKLLKDRSRCLLNLPVETVENIEEESDLPTSVTTTVEILE